MTEPFFLFLDFDGVCHPGFPRDDRTDEQNRHFSCLPRIEAVLREHPDVLVVISSDWRVNYSLEELRQRFSEDLRSRVVGTTMKAKPSWEHGLRQKQVEAYLRDAGHAEARWIALDDYADNFEEGAPLVLCNDEFAEREEALLREMLRPIRILKK